MRETVRLLSIFLVLFLLLATVLPADAAKKKKRKSPPKPVPTNKLSIPSKERIVVFVADGWSYCTKAERYFARLCIPFEARDIQENDKFHDEWKKNFAGDIVPLIVFDNGKQVVEGYDLKQIKRAMKAVGIAPPPN